MIPAKSIFPEATDGMSKGVTVSWPQEIKTTNQVRLQLDHLIGVAPTVLKAARSTCPPRRVQRPVAKAANNVCGLTAPPPKKYLSLKSEPYWKP